MTTLQSIRNHGTILLIVVGIAMLAFILGDFLNSGSSFFSKNLQNVAEIAGHKVHYTEYEAAIDQLTEAYKIETRSNDINEDMSIQLREQAWQMIVSDYTMREQAKQIGMEITSDELSDLCFGTHTHPIIRQSRTFSNGNGGFDQANLINFLGSLKQTPESAEQAQSIEQAKKCWSYWENAVRISHMQEKYTDLFSNLITVNPLEAKYSIEARNTTVDVQYVQQPYIAVADSLVTVADSDIKDLYNKQKQLYKQKPNRSIEYVAIPIAPSAEDFAEVEKLFKSLENDFKTIEDVATIVNSNSDILYDGRDYSAETVPAEYKDFAFGNGAKKNACTEIQLTDNTYAIARIMDCGYSKSDSVKLVMVATEEGAEDVELGWFKSTDLQKNISEPAFNGKKGETFTVSNGMGEQTFKIADKSPATPKVKLAILSRNVTASNNTYNKLFNQAKQFVVANNHADSIRKAATEKGWTTVPAHALTENTYKVNNIKSSRDIVKWAFSAEKGQVSDVFECGDQFIIAGLIEINDGEYSPIETVRADLTIQVMNKKKADYITGQIKSVKTLEDAAKLFATEVKTADSISLITPQLGAAGVEPAVIGTALTLTPNTISKPIVGNNGVYLITVGEKRVSDTPINVEEEIKQLSMYTAYTKSSSAIQLLQEKAEIKDNRARFQ
jgi:peptidyl-prolyl cis-trans isomerase D